MPEFDQTEWATQAIGHTDDEILTEDLSRMERWVPMVIVLPESAKVKLEALALETGAETMEDGPTAKGVNTLFDRNGWTPEAFFSGMVVKLLVERNL